MGKLKSVILDMEEMLLRGDNPQDIADSLGLPLKEVLKYEEKLTFNDSDFDYESDADALASAGFGTNEDYGDFGGFDDSY